MGKIKGLLDQFDIDSKFLFDLKRRTGKNIYLKNGNEMVNANERLHHAPKAILMAHLRNLGTVFGYKFKKQNDIKKKDFVYTEMNPCHVIAIVHPPTLARMDAPNWYPTIKGLMDGMTDAGIFSDDNDNVVKSITFVPGEKTRNKKYLIELNIIKGRRPPLFRQMTFDEVFEMIC